MNPVFEAGASIQRVLEAGLVQGENFDLIAGGDAGGVPRLIDDQVEISKFYAYQRAKKSMRGEPSV